MNDSARAPHAKSRDSVSRGHFACQAFGAPYSRPGPSFQERFYEYKTRHVYRPTTTTDRRSQLVRAVSHGDGKLHTRRKRYRPKDGSDSPRPDAGDVTVTADTDTMREESFLRTGTARKHRGRKKQFKVPVKPHCCFLQHASKSFGS